MMPPKNASHPNVGAADRDNPAVVHERPVTPFESENARLRGDLRTISRRLTHDLRNPLNCISTASEALRDPAAPPDSMTDQFVRSISDSVEEAVALVERLSAVLKATADPVPPQLVKMEEIVAGTLERLAPRLASAGATLAKPVTWPEVEGVPAWIGLIWQNLIGNSLQHAGALPQLELGWDRSERGIRCWIRDSGRGIALEKRARLFHPLERLHEVNAPRGYGLAIVRRLIELQGGQCGYEADPAPSGTFWFVLSRSDQV